MRADPSADGMLFLVYITLIWIGMILGFGRETANHFKNDDPPYPINDVLALGIGAYDLLTCGRLPPAYVAGLIWSFGWQITHVSLYLWPA
jgi:hypothetical protein